jgi:hypothetical protein
MIGRGGYVTCYDQDGRPFTQSLRGPLDETRPLVLQAIDQAGRNGTPPPCPRYETWCWGLGFVGITRWEFEHMSPHAPAFNEAVSI